MQGSTLMLSLVLLITCQVLALTATQWADAKHEGLEDPSCKASGMCSIGESKFAKGDISQKGVLAEVLGAVSYKKEVIEVSIFGHHYAEMVIQLWEDFKGLGMSHMLALSTQETYCQSVWKMVPELSCAWDTSPVHPLALTGGVHLMHVRLRFIARALRLGYNVLNLDSDYHLYQDPYIYFKSPPMDKVTFFTSPESGCGINTGFLYIQNARPNGPVSWMFKHVSELPLRWSDDEFAMLKQWGKMKDGDSLCMTFDQAFMDDALHSVMSGKPIAWNTIFTCVPEGADKDSPWAKISGSNVSRQEALSLQEHSYNCHSLHAEVVPVPHWWPPTHYPRGTHYTTMHTAEIRVPNTNDENFEPGWGGRFYPETKGVYSQAFYDQLADDCPNCPTWPDTKASDAEAAWNNTETFGFAPRWLACWAWELTHGYLTPVDGSRPRQVMVHAHALPGGERYGKLSVRRIYNAFHWNKSFEINKKVPLNPPGPYMIGTTPPERVLAISPHFDLTRTVNKLEMRLITMGLMQLAMLSNRTLVYPEPPCAAAWMLKNHNTSGCDASMALEPVTLELMPYAALDDPAAGASSTKSVRFASTFTLHGGCVGGGQNYYTGMLNVEFERWLLHDCPSGTAKEPGPTNSAFLRGHSIIMPKKEDEPADWSVGEVLVKLPIAEAFMELKRLDAAPLVFVAHPVVVDFLTNMGQSSHISSVSAEEQLHLKTVVDSFHDKFLKQCAHVFEHPWEWGRNYPGKPEHVVGLKGFMRDDGVQLEDGAKFPDGRRKPWTDEDLVEPEGSAISHKHRMAIATPHDRQWWSS